MSDAPRPPAQRLAASYFLGTCFVAFVVVLWLRGAGRIVLPLVSIGGAAWVVMRVVRKVREPLP
ncbi:MAG TPA: hypothetical protein VFZ65_20755 [Planctomycetota bacterium]|nr:hypothetical protein [Planctomycetota bacterium]